MKQSKEMQKTSWGSKLSYGCGASGAQLMNGLFSSFLLAYYTDTALIGAAAISTMFVFSRIFDGITDILFGAAIDKTKTKYGKARPWILASAPLMLLGIGLVMSINPEWSDGTKLVYAYLTYFFANCVSLTVAQMAQNALLAKMTMNMSDRMAITTTGQVMSGIVSAIIGTCVTPAVIVLGWQKISWILGAIAFVCYIINFVGTKEVVGVSENLEKEDVSLKIAFRGAITNKYFWLSMIMYLFLLILNANAIQSLIFYCNWVLQNPMYISVFLGVCTIPSLFVLVLLPAAAKRYSKQRIMQVVTILLMLSFLLCGFGEKNIVFAIVGVVLRNIGTSFMFTLGFAFLPDIVDYNEYKTGVRSIGVINASSGIGVKIGIGLGSALTGWILALTGYNGAAAVQSASVVTGIKFTFSWMGLILSACLLIISLFMDIEKKMPEIQAALIEKHARA